MREGGHTPQGIDGSYALWGMAGEGRVGGSAYMNDQNALSRNAAAMLNGLSLDTKVRREVDEVKRLLQDVTMSERRTHPSNVEIGTGMGDSMHLTRQRVKLLKALDDLIHLTGNERIAQFRAGCMAFLDVLDERRDAASKYRHGQAGKVFMVLAERQIDDILAVLLEFVAADFGGKPEVKPRRGILRSLFARKVEDPTKWYLKFDFSR
jgi:hypothetical protein